ncbi:MAG: hypothetical protein IPO95_01280 [Rhodanobacteraceae bacterium]|nr:hypothetical protein [Rhodanobacteraceae bacterium]
MKITSQILLSALIGGATFSAFAAGFESWSMTEKRTGATTIVVSFAGDGEAQDAQVDMPIPAGYKLVKASVKVPGSVCVGTPDGKLRAVPPSGAGQALSTKNTDYCSFMIKPEKAGSQAKVAFATTQAVCGSPAKGEYACAHSDASVSE